MESFGLYVGAFLSSHSSKLWGLSLSLWLGTLIFLSHGKPSRFVRRSAFLPDLRALFYM